MEHSHNNENQNPNQPPVPPHQTSHPNPNAILEEPLPGSPFNPSMTQNMPERLRNRLEASRAQAISNLPPQAKPQPKSPKHPKNKSQSPPNLSPDPSTQKLPMETHKHYMQSNPKTQRLMYRGGIAHGLYNGQGTRFHSNGKVEYIGFWLNGKMHQSRAEIFGMNGLLEFRGDIFDGLRSGVGEEYWVNGILKSKEFYRDGLVESDNAIIYSRHNHCHTGVVTPQTKFMQMKKNEMMTVEEGYVVMKSSKMVDPSEAKLIYRGQIKGGKRSGFGVSFDENNGSISYIGFWKNDVYDSQFGKLFWNYIESFGNVLFYNSNLEPVNSVGEDYRQDLSQVCEDIFQRNDFLKVKNYDRSCIDRILGEMSYVKCGNLKYAGELHCGLFNGLGISYNRHGKIHAEGNFLNQRPHDPKMKIYYEQGSLMYMGSIVKGEFHGKGVQYEPNGKMQFYGLIERNVVNAAAAAQYWPNGQTKEIFSQKLTSAGQLP